MSVWIDKLSWINLKNGDRPASCLVARPNPSIGAKEPAHGVPRHPSGLNLRPYPVLLDNPLAVAKTRGGSDYKIGCHSH